MIEIHGYVLEANSRSLRVIALNVKGEDFLKQSGFTQQNESSFSRDVRDQDELLDLFRQFQTFNMAFSAGRGWWPSELFEVYRDQGSLCGDYVRVAWKGPGDPILTVC